jgi:hypothetical protein
MVTDTKDCDVKTMSVPTAGKVFRLGAARMKQQKEEKFP